MDATRCIWNLTACGSLHLARQEYKSLMSEGYGELKSTCPLCSMKAPYGGDRQDAVIWLS